MTIKSGDSFSQLKYFNNWIVDWTNLNKYPIIKFEDFKKNKYQFIKKVVKFSSIKDFNDTQIEQIIKNLSISSKKDIPIGKKIKFFGKNAFRKVILEIGKIIFPVIILNFLKMLLRVSRSFKL